jgi:hypothetical protein
MRKILVLGFMGMLCAVGANAATFSMATRGGKNFTMETSKDRVTSETTEFMICGRDVQAVKRIKLWMPEHGHGSTPVQLGALEDGCRVASRVNFTMSGNWEVRVELTDGDSGAFVVEVD